MPANLPLFPTLQLVSAGAGLRTDFGQLLPPGPRVSYVRSTGVQSGDPTAIAERLLPTLDAGLKECRSGMGDFVIVLPGHTETVTSTSFANLVAGTRILGYGDLNRDDSPTFTWSTAAATWAISVKNVYISGLRLLMDNFNGVTAPVNVTASGCSFVGNFMRWSSGASLKATTAVTVGSGATDFFFGYNDVYGVAAGVCTNGISLIGATTPDRFKCIGNNFAAACTTTNGLINVSVAALAIQIENNKIFNCTAVSVAGIVFANVACTGSCSSNNITVLNATTITQGTTGITVGGTSNLVGFFQNFTVNSANASGLLTPAVDT